MSALKRTPSMVSMIEKKKMAAANSAASTNRKLEEYVTAHGGTRVLRTILIANNGMAATKVRRVLCAVLHSPVTTRCGVSRPQRRSCGG